MASNHHHPGDGPDDRIGGGRGRGRGRSYYAPSDSSAYDPRRSHLDDRPSYYEPSKPDDGGRRRVPRDDDDRGRGDDLGIDERGRPHSSREYGRSARERSRSRSASPSDRGGDRRGYRRNEEFAGGRPPGVGESSRGASGPASRDRGDSEKEDLEAARRARMARLRAENDEEEQGMAGGNNNPNGSAAAGADTVRRSGVVDASALEGLDEEEQMRLMLGFDGFGSTKNTKVADNHQTSARGAAAKNKARKYRQYMNRKNGFNRPLDKMD